MKLTTSPRHLPLGYRRLDDLLLAGAPFRVIAIVFDVASDQLFGALAEHAALRIVHIGDPAFEVGGRDLVLDLIEGHRLKAQALFVPFPLGDVAREDDETVAAVRDIAGTDVHIDQAAVFAAIACFEPGVAALRDLAQPKADIVGRIQSIDLAY